MPEPEIPKADEWGSVYTLNREKEVVGIFISGHPLDDFRIEIDSFCNGKVGMLNDMEQHKNKDLLIAATITEAEHRFTKNGDPFGTLTIEDYTDSYRIFLWRENYLKYKHFIAPGAFIALKGRIEVPRNRKDLEFIINNIDMLQDLKENRAKNVSIKLTTKQIDHALISDLNKLFLAHEGKCSLTFSIKDPLDNIEINMPSKSFKVEPNNSLFKELKRLNIDYKLS